MQWYPNLIIILIMSMYLIIEARPGVDCDIYIMGHVIHYRGTNLDLLYQMITYIKNSSA